MAGVKKVYFLPNVRDHRWLPVARLVPVERSGTSTRRDAGSHSVDRIVRSYFWECGLEKRHTNDGFRRTIESISSAFGNNPPSMQFTS